jgi:predicted nucleotidyltransferase
MINEMMTAYVDSLSTALHGNLGRVVLYGSCARGDHEVGSDIDVLILVKDSSRDVIDLIQRISDKIDWQYDTLISNTVRSFDSYEKGRQESLYMNIKKEGKVYYGEAG